MLVNNACNFIDVADIYDLVHEYYGDISRHATCTWAVPGLYVCAPCNGFCDAMYP